MFWFEGGAAAPMLLLSRPPPPGTCVEPEVRSLLPSLSNYYVVLACEFLYFISLGPWDV